LQIYILDCKFFWQSIDEFLETWGFVISFATYQSGNGGRAAQPAAGLKAKASEQQYGTIDTTSVF